MHWRKIGRCSQIFFENFYFNEVYDYLQIIYQYH